MFRRTLALLVHVLFFAGCASNVPAPRDGLPWRDAAFAYDPAMVSVRADDLFRLDEELLRKARAASPKEHGVSQRLRMLLTLVFGADLRDFAYAGGHSTIASETWRERRGDCLSLAVLTYAVARAMEIPAQMQEVQVAAILERRGEFDVVNQHVNVLFPNARKRSLEDSLGGNVVVDFDPEQASGRPGRLLSESAVLARYYNNVATEHLTAGRLNLAYAHFKAAVAADPSYASSYSNLAVLYRQMHMDAEAEQLLVHAASIADPADVSLAALQQLMTDQGRSAEAEHYAKLLESRRSSDPYHWIGRGLALLESGDARGAIVALEKARSLSVGFDEVHRYLAVAYWRAGERARAAEELSLLAQATGDDKDAARLRGKLKKLAPQ